MSASQDHVIQYLSEDSRHYRAFRDQYRVQDLVTHWRNYTSREDRFNRYAEMTSHGPSHLESVSGLVAQFALPFRKGGGLNDSEMFVLNAMAHLHDLGMYTTFDPHFDDPLRIRKIHGYLSREAILRESVLLFPGVDDQNAIRIIALLGSYHQGSAALSDRELAKIPQNKQMRIPAAHRIHGIEESDGADFVQWSLETELKYSQSQGQDMFHLAHTGEDICPFQLGALSKLLDGCDFQSARIGSIETLFRHADRNRSHLQRTVGILEASVAGSPSQKRALIEEEFFSISIFHFLRNLMIEKTMILASSGKLQIVIKPVSPADVESQANALIESMGSMPWGQSETQRRLTVIRDLVRSYIANPMQTICDEVGRSPDDSSLAEWDVRNVPPDPCENVHYRIARKYIHREYNAVCHAMAGPRGSDWRYCEICVNRDKCSLKNRDWPTLARSDGTCNVVAYDAKLHAAMLSTNPQLAYKVGFTPPHPYFQRVSEERLIWQRLHQNKRLVLAGPDGRGKSSLMASLANRLKGSAVPAVFYFSFADNKDQPARFIRAFAAFLAARGDFLLSNLIVDEEPSTKHESALLGILRTGRKEHFHEPLLMCLDDFNRVAGEEEFFKAVVEQFPRISSDSTEVSNASSGPGQLESEASSLVLIASTKRPGDRWGNFPIETYEVPALTDGDITQLTDRCRDKQLAAEGSEVWRAYGSEAFVIPIWQKYSGTGWGREHVLRLFETDIVSWLVESFREKLGSERSLNIMRLVALLDGSVTDKEIRDLFKLPVREGEDELTMLFDRGLLQVDDGKLRVRSVAWSEGHRRSRWLDRLGGSISLSLETYIRSSEIAAEQAAAHWSDLQVYFPGETAEDVRSTKKKRADQ